MYVYAYMYVCTYLHNIYIYIRYGQLSPLKVELRGVAVDVVQLRFSYNCTYIYIYTYVYIHVSRVIVIVKVTCIYMLVCHRRYLVKIATTC